MNKNQIILGTILALGLAWMGCNKSGKLAEHSTFTPPSGPVELKLKWPVGERVVQDMDMKEGIDITVPGQADPIKQQVTMGQEYAMKVLAATPDGGHEVEMEFASIRMGETMAGKSMLDYDSEKKSADDKPDPLSDTLKKIVGSKIRFFLDADNKVDHMEGVDQLIGSFSSVNRADQAAILKGIFNEGYFKQMMSHYLFMPTNAVQPGDTWPVHFEFPLEQFGTLVLDYTFTFQTWEMHGARNCARLDFQGTIKSNPDPDANHSGLTINIKDGTSAGKSWFDPELGITIDTTTEQDLNADVTVPANMGGRNGNPQNVSISLSEVMNIKLASVK